MGGGHAVWGSAGPGRQSVPEATYSLPASVLGLGDQVRPLGRGQLELLVVPPSSQARPCPGGSVLRPKVWSRCDPGQKRLLWSMQNPCSLVPPPALVAGSSGLLYGLCWGRGGAAAGSFMEALGPTVVFPEQCTAGSKSQGVAALGRILS